MEVEFYIEGSKILERSTGQTWKKNQQKPMGSVDEQGSSLSVCAEVFRSCSSTHTNLIKVLKAAHYLDFNTQHIDSVECELPVMFS